LGAGIMVKLRQIRQHPEIAAEKLDFFRFIFDVFSCFLFFSDCFCRFCFRFLSVFLVFESNLTKSKNCKKHRVFHFSIFFEPKRQFQFIFELFLNPKNVNFQFIFELDGIVELFSNLKHLLIFFSPLPVRLPQWSSRPWQDLLQQAKSHVLGTFCDDGKQTSYGFDKIGDDFVMLWVMMNMLINWKRKYFWISNVWPLS
jgi:hypothetical protein